MCIRDRVKADIPKEVAAVADTIAKSEKPVREYRFPPLSLLKHGSKTSGDSDAHLRETAAKLQKTLQTFGVNVTITNISCCLLYTSVWDRIRRNY